MRVPPADWLAAPCAQLSLDRQLLQGVALVNIGDITEATAADTARRRGPAVAQCLEKATGSCFCL